MEPADYFDGQFLPALCILKLFSHINMWRFVVVFLFVVVVVVVVYYLGNSGLPKESLYLSQYFVSFLFFACVIPVPTSLNQLFFSVWILILQSYTSENPKTRNSLTLRVR